MTSCFQHLLSLHEVCKFQTKEGARVGTASKSELRRWFADRRVRINYQIVAANDELPAIIIDITLFPKNDQKRITLLHENVTFITLPEEAVQADHVV